MTFCRTLPESFFSSECAGGDDKEDVEHRRADDGPDPHVVLGDEDADDGGEELWSAAAGGHERGSGHIRTNSQLEERKETV